jgi:phosphatidylglycerol:prolipoprotein diacylglycerol transferase
VAWYGIFVTLGFCMAICIGCIKLVKYGVSTEPFYYFCFVGIPAAILGARMGSCIIGQTQ